MNMKSSERRLNRGTGVPSPDGTHRRFERRSEMKIVYGVVFSIRGDYLKHVRIRHFGPPLSTFHATYQQCSSAKLGNFFKPPFPTVRTSFRYRPLENGPRSRYPHDRLQPSKTTSSGLTNSLAWKLGSNDKAEGRGGHLGLWSSKKKRPRY